MTDARFAALMQLIGTLLLLSDAFIPRSTRKAVDRYLRRNSDEYIRAYGDQLRSDWKILGRFIGAGVVYFYTMVFFPKIVTWMLDGNRVQGALISVALSISAVMSLREIKRLSQFSGIYLRLVFIVPVCFAFAKSPRGPIYVLGFAMSLFGLIIQFQSS